MKKIINLTKVLYKTNKNNSEKINKKTKPILYIGLGAYILFIFANFWNLFINPLKELGRPELSIGLMINITSTFVLMTSITYVINVLYFSNDMENLLPLPFKPKEIFASKLLTVYLYQLMVTAMLLLPGLVAYGQIMNEGLLFYLYSVLILLMLPIMPILLVTMICTVIMQFIKLTKYKNFFKVSSSIVLVAIVVIFQMNLNSNITNTGDYSGEFILSMSENLNNSALYFTKIFVDSLNLNNVFLSTISLIWLVLLNLGIIFLVVNLFDKLYMKGIYNNLNGTSYRKVRKNKLECKVKSKGLALAIKDMKSLFRNSTFLIQCVIPVFLMPIIIVAMSVTSMDEANMKMFGELESMKFYLSVLLVQFFMLTNYISVTAISRDGKDESSYIKTLPIKFEKQISAKVMPSVIFGLINLIISLFYVYKIFKLNLAQIILLGVIGTLLNFLQSYLYVIIDIKHPKLYWESEIAVVKQNMNIFTAIFVWIGVIIITSIIVNLFVKVDIAYFTAFYISLLASAFLMIKLYIRKNSIELFDSIN